ncbi:MAG: hypothetical protein WA160_06185 [Pseudobdellovibrio sp.]
MDNSLQNSFDQWQLEKKMKVSDLVFTQSLKTTFQQDLFEKVAIHITSLKPSFSEGLKALELATELILMGHQETLFENGSTLEACLLHLQHLRYPHTTSSDTDLKTKLENLPWPSQTKVKFERRGDRAGVEVKLFISSASDLTKIIASLERVQIEIAK